MSAIMECSCGKKVKIPDHLMGKKVKCPCGNTIDTAPDREPQEQLSDIVAKDKKIQVRCTCGKALNIPEHLIGKKVKCPCGNVLTAALEEDTNADDPENIAQGFVSVYTIIGYLLYAFAALDFAAARIFGIDITGVFWSPFVLSLVGLVLTDYAKRHQVKLAQAHIDKENKKEREQAESEEIFRKQVIDKMKHDKEKEEQLHLKKIKASELSARGEKECPYCGEVIKQAASKCRFCGETLNAGEAEFIVVE